MQLHLFRFVFAVVSIFAVSIPAAAAPIVYTLNGVTFGDGGTASGSFTYNPVTNTYSSVNISTTSGSARIGANYAFVSSGAPPSSSFVVFVSSAAANQSGLPALGLSFLPVLSSAGGGANVAAVEANCLDPACVAAAPPIRTSVAGTVGAVGAAPALIPTLSSWAIAALTLMLALAAGIATGRRGRRARAAH